MPGSYKYRPKTVSRQSRGVCVGVCVIISSACELGAPLKFSCQPKKKSEMRRWCNPPPPPPNPETIQTLKQFPSGFNSGLFASL